MSWILNIVYAAVIVIAFPWLLHAAIFKGKYREGFAAKFLGNVPKRKGNRPCIWLHAVSVGEVNLLATLIDEIELRRPDVESVVSTTTMTGYALAKKKYAPRMVFYCPLDFSWAVDAAMKRIRPDVLLLAELELWPNLIRAARKSGAKVAVVNGRLSEKSFRGYTRVAPLVRRILSQLDLIAVQNEEYAERFGSLLSKREGEAPAEPLSGKRGPAPQERRPPGIICVTGSLKFDGAKTDRNNPKTCELAALAGITDDDIVFLAGSTQAPEEELALESFKLLTDKHPELRLILVPRHPDRFDEVAALLDQSGLPWQRRSQLVGTGSLPVPESRQDIASSRTKQDTRYQPQGTGWQPGPTGARILLVDTIGELGAWWGTARIAYVGGSMGSRGGQNMIEPAAYGAAVSFGPNTWNFRDIVQLVLGADAAIVVNDGEELTEFVRRCLEDPNWAKDLGQAAQNLVSTQLGATKRTIDAVEPLLPPSASVRVAA